MLCAMEPSLLLFAQHGWADTNDGLQRLAQLVAPPDTRIVAPDLGYWRTWLTIEPLIATVEETAQQVFAQHPGVPVRIIGHSMGGLIWVELLYRHMDWWSRVESLVLIGSPLGGAHLARMVDPLRLGIGIARDLGENRRAKAELIAAIIPTLGIAGDIGDGSDGVVAVEAARLRCSRFVVLEGSRHEWLFRDLRVAELIEQFWHDRPAPAILRRADHDAVIDRLRAVPGMTDAHCRDMQYAHGLLTFKDGATVREWVNPLGVRHVFFADAAGACRYAGYVGWVHLADLHEALRQLTRDYEDDII